MDKHKHKLVILEVLDYLRPHNLKFILKGGTALMLCYALNRFSEDIDLDGAPGWNIIPIIEKFCKLKGYVCRVGKDTKTVQRCFINYGNIESPLKIEVSFRRRELDTRDIIMYSDSIFVYGIESLLSMKLAAYSGRDKLRDIYDVTFICLNYWSSLSPLLRDMARSVLSYKELEYVNYILQEQSDELIDKDKLLSDFLTLLDKLGLVV